MTTAQPRLADRLALAILEHGPSSGTWLAVVVEARKAAVLDELRSNPMFVSDGRARGSRWRLDAGNRLDTTREPMGTNPGGGSGPDDEGDLAERLKALERRVAELERQLADLGAPTE